MNLKLVLKVVGRVMLVEGASMVFPLIVALLYHEDPTPFLGSIFMLLLLGFGLSAIPAKKHFYAREGFFAVGFIWLLTGLMGAMPFFLSGTFPSFIDCLLAMSKTKQTH